MMTAPHRGVPGSQHTTVQDTGTGNLNGLQPIFDVTKGSMYIIFNITDFQSGRYRGQCFETYVVSECSLHVI